MHPSTTNCVCVCARVRSKQKMGNNKQGMPTILTYLAFDGKDVRARWAEEPQRLAHACILYQQQVSTCWTELHSLSVCNTTISTCKQRPCETMFCKKKRKGRRLFSQQFWCSPPCLSTALNPNPKLGHEDADDLVAVGLIVPRIRCRMSVLEQALLLLPTSL